jgi:hypothetical protein
MNHATKLGLIALTAALLLGSQAGSPVKAAEEHAHIGRPGTRVMDGRGQVLDSRYNHGYYYPALGASVRVGTGHTSSVEDLIISTVGFGMRRAVRDSWSSDHRSAW